MKKLIVIGCIAAISGLFAPQVKAGGPDSTATSEQVDSTAVASDSTKKDSSVLAAKPALKKTAEAKEASEKDEADSPGFTQVIKEKLIEGGVWFMGIVLLCLIIGLTIAIERVITLNLASTNIKKLLTNVKSSLSSNGMDGAREELAKTKGPVATVFAQGLLRSHEGIEGVEKSIEGYGSAEVARLEKGMSWIALFIALAPMFGFMGTVIGMIDAFDKIEAAADINISDVAGGIKVALLTTVAGLIVAVILQIFYNYCVSKMDDIASQMEDASNSFVSMLSVDEKIKSKK